MSNERKIKNAEYMRKWRLVNPDKVRISARKRNLRNKAAKLAAKGRRADTHVLEKSDYYYIIRDKHKEIVATLPLQHKLHEFNARAIMNALTYTDFLERLLFRLSYDKRISNPVKKMLSEAHTLGLTLPKTFDKYKED